MQKKLEIGRHNKLPHYSVIGDKTDFYIWVNEDGGGKASRWIKGREAFDIHAKLSMWFKKDKIKFIEMIKAIHAEHLK